MLTEEGQHGIQMSDVGKGAGNNASSSTAPPLWVEDVNAVERTLDDIIRAMDRLQSMHAQRVGSVFGKDLENMEGRIEALTQEITDLFRQSERHLQKVGMATRRAGDAEQATVGANVQRR